MSCDPPVPSGPEPALSHRQWDALPVVRSHIDAVAAGSPAESPADLRIALERLLRAALGAAPPE